MSFKKYIKAVGTGPKGNRDLEKDEMIDAIEHIIDRKASDAQIGAFLVAWRTEGESTQELAAMVQALKKYMSFEKVENSIELGYSFDGRVKNPFLFPLYEELLKDFYKNNSDIKELKLIISTDLLQPAKNGLTAKDLADSLKSNEYVKIFDRSKYLPKLTELTSLRHELGLRTAFNTVEKLLNPAQSEYGVTTAFHKPYVQKYLDIYDGFDDIVVVKASEGSPEVFKDGKYWRRSGEEIIEESFSLKDFGINYEKEYEKISLEEAKLAIENPSEEIIKLAKFNLCLYLLFARRIDSLTEAWERFN